MTAKEYFPLNRTFFLDYCTPCRGAETKQLCKETSDSGRCSAFGCKLQSLTDSREVLFHAGLVKKILCFLRGWVLFVSRQNWFQKFPERGGSATTSLLIWSKFPLGKAWSPSRVVGNSGYGFQVVANVYTWKQIYLRKCVTVWQSPRVLVCSAPSWRNTWASFVYMPAKWN